MYYAFARNPLSSKPRWTRQIGVPADGEGGTGACLASAVWDNLNHRLFLAGNQTPIDTTTYGGSVLSVAPTTGTPIWQTGLPCAAMGTPSLNHAGVLAVATLSACVNGGQPAVYLLDASIGTILTTLVPGAKTFAQPVFDGTKLFIATETQGLYAFNPN